MNSIELLMQLFQNENPGCTDSEAYEWAKKQTDEIYNRKKVERFATKEKEEDKPVVH